MSDPYKVLNIAPTATDDEVKHAYRELARKYHPDNYHDNPLADLAQEKVFDLFGDTDLISFLFSGQYLRQDHPYHFSHWNDLQFYMPSVEPKQGLASLFD